jgi:putative transposase
VFFQMLVFVWMFILALAAISRLSDEAKDLELLLLRQQLRIVERRQQRGPHIPRWQKVPLAALAHRLTVTTVNASELLVASVQLFKPETILNGHREAVRRKWTFKRKQTGGRPRTDPEIEALSIQIAREDPRWGHKPIHGESGKLGIDLDPTTVANLMKRHGILPVPQRGRSTWLKTVYVLFFIEMETRRVFFAGRTTAPTDRWITQQARQLIWTLAESSTGSNSHRFLMHDCDQKFTSSFDTMFRSEQMKIIRTPYRAPRADAVAGRWVRSVRQECLDHILIVNEQHLCRVLKEYVAFYNGARPIRASISGHRILLKSPSGRGNCIVESC